MPIFEYECLECGHIEERIILTRHNTTPRCCFREMTQTVTAPSIRFNGPGFYVNDYREDKIDAV